MNLKSILEALEIEENEVKQTLVEGATLLGVAGAILLGKKIKEKVESEIKRNPGIRNVLKEVETFTRAHQQYVAGRKRKTPPAIKIVRKQDEESSREGGRDHKENNS
jgi:uncharacterized membrane protein